MKFSKTFFLFFLSLCLPAILSAQNKPDSSSRINFIKNQYTLINSRLSYYKTVIKKDNRKSQSTNGGQVTGYFDDGELKKIVGNYYSDTGRATYEYYYYKSKLIFYFGTTYHNRTPLSAHPKHVKIDATYQGRLYFYKGSLISYVNSPVKTFTQAELKQVISETLNEDAHMLNLVAGR